MITAASSFTDLDGQIAKEPIFLITIDGYARAFTNLYTGVAGQYDWLTDIQDLAITVSDLDGGADLQNLVFSVQDVNGLITAAFPTFTFEGKKVILKTGFVGMLQADFVTIFTGFIANVDSANANQEYTFNVADQTQLLSQNIYVTGDDGQPTSDDHPKTVIGHPLDILLDILVSQIDMPLVDTTKIEAYRDDVFSGLEFKFKITSPPAAKDFIEQQIMQALGGYLWTNNLGKVSVNFFYQQDRSADASIGDDQVMEDPVAEQAELVNSIQYKFDQNDNDYFSQSLQLFGTSISLYGAAGALELALDGVRSALGGFFLASFVSRIIFLRYGLKTLKFEGVQAIWEACIFEPGDLLAFTNPTVPDRVNGVVGITNKKFEVLDRTWHFADGTVEFTLLDSTYLAGFGTSLIAPDATLDYTSETSDNKAKYMFLSDDLGKYSNGDNAHGLA